MLASIDSSKQARDIYFSSKSNNSAVQVDGFQVARNNIEDRSDSSGNEDSFASGNKRKEKKPPDMVSRKSIRKKPDKNAKAGEKPGGVDKKRFGSQEKRPLVDWEVYLNDAVVVNLQVQLKF